jgi:hypothetical protein
MRYLLAYLIFIGLNISLLFSQGLNVLDLYVLRNCNDLTVTNYFLGTKDFNYIGCLGEDENNHDIFKFSDGINWVEYSSYPYTDSAGCTHNYTKLMYYIAKKNDYIEFIETLKVLDFKLYSDDITKEGDPIQIWTKSAYPDILNTRLKMLSIVKQGTIYRVAIFG